MGKIRKILNLDRQLEKGFFRQRADMLTYQALHSSESGVTSVLYNGQELIVSLTSYSKRIFDVGLTIESLMQQTLKPNRIILWLQPDLRGQETAMLNKQKDRGLEIRYTQDIKSYKKLIPTLREFPDCIVVTVDDDVLYYPDLLERLYRSYIEAPEMIHAMRMHRITLDKRGLPKSYHDWKRCVYPLEDSILNVPVGVGGVLYPPGVFDAEVFNTAAFMKLAPYADDMWFKAMSMRKGTLCRKACSATAMGEDYLQNPNVQDIGLFRHNTKNGGNEQQLAAIIDVYGLQFKK